jgi:hypothetical protein
MVKMKIHKGRIMIAKDGVTYRVGGGGVTVSMKQLCLIQTHPFTNGCSIFKIVGANGQHTYTAAKIANRRELEKITEFLKKYDLPLVCDGNTRIRESVVNHILGLNYR